MIQVVLSLGSNCGDKRRSVADALTWLRSVLAGAVASEIYLTPSAGKSSGDYANCVVKGLYDGSVESLNTLCKNYELSEGRDSECREKGRVPIDIDIVIADADILKPWDYRQEFFRKGFLSL